MRLRIRYSKPIAAFFLTLMTAQMVYPVCAYALTSGPTQPEAASFTPAGVSDMVDMFSGDFKYNLPLMDVDGYPVNLAYQSGSGTDDEASWVGLGWNLNVGSINRQLRGNPDDWKSELVKTHHYYKPKIVVGGRVSLKAEFFGQGRGPGLNAGLSLGVFNNNYTGIGAELGANAGLSVGFTNSGTLTGNMGVGLLSSTAEGVDVNTNASLSFTKQMTDNLTVGPGVSSSLGYNTRGGIKQLQLGTSFNVASYGFGNSTTISYNTNPVFPQAQIPYTSERATFSFDIGGAGAGIFAGGGITGYRNIQKVKNPDMNHHAYGFLYAEAGKNDKDALMDFTREKDNPVIPEIPNLAIPVHTPDLFSYTSQAGSGQFRLYRGGTGILFDNEAVDEISDVTAGFDAGAGAFAHGGVNFFDQGTTNKTGKWTDDNAVLKKADFQDISDNPVTEHAFFKKSGEINKPALYKTTAASAFYQKLWNAEPVAIDISGKQATSFLRDANGNTSITSNITQDDKQPKTTVVTYLTAKEVKLKSADGRLPVYDFNTLTNVPVSCHKPVLQSASLRPLIVDDPTPNDRSDDLNVVRKEHHLSEITVTETDGKRNVYGIPVYNTKLEEYTFAVGSSYNTADVATKNQVPLVFDNNGNIKHDLGVDHYWHKEEKPAYATGFLLTGILSPDYVDVTNDGITDDDLGTAVKFNYSKVSENYKWRSVVEANRANLVKGQLADPDDDKASFIYGEKELWYLHSIESKNKIAYFITEDRYDAMGVIDWRGGVGGTHQKVLKEIRLYSKADLTQPIKTVKLDYGYDLCQQLPNFDAAQAATFPKKGKLTLKKVYFTYANSTKGSKHPYEFVYNNEGANDPFTYGYLQTDQWGVLKPTTYNATAGFSLRNDEFPYAVQNKTNADVYAGVWQLSTIKLPTGGEINVTYESDDYGYVQNKRAMIMSKVDALIKSDNSVATDLQDATGIRLTIQDIPAGSGLPWFKENVLNGSDYLYTKLFINLSDQKTSTSDQYFDFVPCYARVIGVDIQGATVNIQLEKSVVKHTAVPGEGNQIDVSPMRMAAWQRMRLEYPRYAYPGYQNRVQDNNAQQAFKQAISAISNAFKNLDELKRNFNHRAGDVHFASVAKLDKSFVRLAAVSGRKLGGGSRVKKIQISDKWAAMSGNANTRSASYGQSYEYVLASGSTESSGVAAYEPSIGADENAMREPIPYIQNIKGALNNYFNLEEPMGESFFPGPSVGYSKVIVRDLDQNGNADPAYKTGYVQHEFYTAKDFPVIVKEIKSKRTVKGPTNSYNPLTSKGIHEQTYSQGYSIELNDMHGKPKAMRVYNQGGSEINSTVYEYFSQNINATEKKLNNSVMLISSTGDMEENQVIGREAELFTDMREQETRTSGTNIRLGFDIIPFVFGAIGLPHWPASINDDYKLFRSTVTVKVVHQYGIVSKVIKTDNGSSVSAQNIAFDALTGEPVITSSTNEFEQPIYTVNVPAYWMTPYKGMGGAYQNAGTIIAKFSSTSSSVSHPTFLQPGDELLDLSASSNAPHYWVIETPLPGGTATKKVINETGSVVQLSERPVKVIRSGYRNILMPMTTSIACLQNPVQYDAGLQKFTLSLASNSELGQLKVLSASATLFNEKWGVPACTTCPPGYTPSEDGSGCVAPVTVNNLMCFTFCKGSADPSYGSGGAIIRDNNGLNPVTRISDFWGGACSTTGTQTVMATNNDNMLSSSASPVTETAGTDSTADSEFATTGSSVATPDVENNASAQFLVSNCERSDTGPYVDAPGDNLCGRLYVNSIWLCESLANSKDEWISFETCFTAPESKTYFVGWASDNLIRIYIDGALFKSATVLDYATFQNWFVDPKFLNAGAHTIRVDMLNGNGLNNGGFAGPAALGLEIYNNTYNELIQPGFNASDANIIFSTAQNVLGNDVQVYRHDGADAKYSCANGTIDVCHGNTCYIPNGVVNPYTTGFAGNWRPVESKVYQVNRQYTDLFNPQTRGADVRNAGAFETFRSFWYVNQALTSKPWMQASSEPKWVSANAMTLYNRQGGELENKDALGRYSAARFTFREDLPGAVATNSRYREIFFDGFEDTKYRSTCIAAQAICDSSMILPAAGSAQISTMVTQSNAHTGNYSLSIPAAGVRIKTIVHSNESLAADYLATNNAGEFMLKTIPGLYPSGFQPYTGKKYILSLWSNQNTGVSVSANGTAITLTPKAKVEGWTQLEGTIDLSTLTLSNNELKLVFNGSGILIDDIRLHPFDAHMKSYAYDEKTLRVMAELDENNFATFYEYDDEGSLVRLKKETDRGILTLRENRSSYRKTP